MKKRDKNSMVLRWLLDFFEKIENNDYIYIYIYIIGYLIFLIIMIINFDTYFDI